MKRYKITYIEEMTEEDIAGIVGEKFTEKVLEEYLWSHLRPEGDEWTVEVFGE